MTLDDSTKLELIQLVRDAVSQAVEAHPLSPEEIHWVRMAIQAEAERAELRKAIIQKSLAGLAWMALSGISVWAIGFFTDHWK